MLTYIPLDIPYTTPTNICPQNCKKYIISKYGNALISNGYQESRGNIRFDTTIG